MSNEWVSEFSDVCCCRLNNTSVCDEHLFRQVSTCLGHDQLPIFHCTKCTWEDILASYFKCIVLNDVMSQNELTITVTILILACYLNGRFVLGCQIVQSLNGGLNTRLKKPVFGPKYLVFKWSAKSCDIHLNNRHPKCPVSRWIRYLGVRYSDGYCTG